MEIHLFNIKQFIISYSLLKNGNKGYIYTHAKPLNFIVHQCFLFGDIILHNHQNYIDITTSTSLIICWCKIELNHNIKNYSSHY